MQAIQTKILAPTDTKDARIKAFCSGGSIVVPVDSDKDIFCQHRDAAWKLIAKMDWERSNFILESGTLPCGDICHVYFIDRR